LTRAERNQYSSRRIFQVAQPAALFDNVLVGWCSKGVSVDSIFPGGLSSSASGFVKPRILILILPWTLCDSAAQEYVKQIAKANI
jgi:hypothetical protein